ncbi:uncharacterized protein LOC125237730 [Leguminivora glycinivorella]|uniref:uncharacterized protein LOC125237730 n=1 Tax=Leguminivora glycinivorella TaxID=1035111 RepID=UPI00200C5EEA|nr:uncharacterized protein LOC125237730 [Leguminivora glycinivorella]
MFQKVLILSIRTMMVLISLTQSSGEALITPDYTQTTSHEALVTPNHTQRTTHEALVTPTRTQIKAGEDSVTSSHTQMKTGKVISPSHTQSMTVETLLFISNLVLSPYLSTDPNEAGNIYGPYDVCPAEKPVKRAIKNTNKYICTRK